jgi:hypothetical protein
MKRYTWIGNDCLKKFGAVFNEDNWSTPKEFTIYGQDDHLTDGNQPYQIIFATGWGYHTVTIGS